MLIPEFSWPGMPAVGLRTKMINSKSNVVGHCQNGAHLASLIAQWLEPWLCLLFLMPAESKVAIEEQVLESWCRLTIGIARTNVQVQLLQMQSPLVNVMTTVGYITIAKGSVMACILQLAKLWKEDCAACHGVAFHGSCDLMHAWHIQCVDKLLWFRKDCSNVHNCLIFMLKWASPLLPNALILCSACEVLHPWIQLWVNICSNGACARTQETLPATVELLCFENTLLLVPFFHEMEGLGST